MYRIKLIFCYLILLMGGSEVLGNTSLISKIDSLNAEAREIYGSDISKAIDLSTIALRYADSIGHLESIDDCNNHLGIFYSSKNELSLAVKHYLKALEIRKKLKDKEGVAYLYYNLCGLKNKEGDFLSAIEYGFRALELLTSLKKENDDSGLYLNLALAHHYNGDFDDAVKYYKIALELELELELNDTTNIAKIHYNWANLYRESNQFTKAKLHFNEALNLFQSIDHLVGKAGVYDALGTMCRDESKFNEALSYFNKSIKIHLNVQDSVGLFYNFLELSELFFIKTDFNESLKYNNRAKEILGSKGGLDKQEQLNRQYASIYKGLKDYKNSFLYLQKAESYKDSIFSTAKARSISLLQKGNAEREKTEAEKAKAEEEIKNQQLTQSLLLAGILSLGLLFGLYVMNQRRIQKSRELTDFKDQQERVIDQRIIGATQEIRKELARNLHNHVATPLTHIKRFIEPIYQQLSFDPEWQANLMQALQIADKAHVVSRDISYQLKPEKIDWVDRIKISMVALEKNKTMRTNLEAKGLSDIAFTKIEGEKISSIIGNLLSNVDKHSKATEVKVNITQNYRHLNIEVVDNGVGFKPQEDSGIGLESIYAGVNELNGKIAIESTKDEGAFVKIDIPITQI